MKISIMSSNLLNINRKSLIKILFSPFGSILFLTFNFGLFTLFLGGSVDAQTSMSNSNYIIRFPNLNSFAGKPTNSQYKLGITEIGRAHV